MNLGKIIFSTIFSIVLACPALGAQEDWETVLRTEMRSQGYSKTEIEDAVTRARRDRGILGQDPEFQLPPDQVERGELQTDVREELIRTRLLALGFAGNELDRRVARFVRMNPEKSERALAALEEGRELDSWLEEMLAPVQDKLEARGWKVGSELKARLDSEVEFLRASKELFDQLEPTKDTGPPSEDSSSTEQEAVSPEILKKIREQIDRKRGEFESELAEQYVAEVARRERRSWSDSLMRQLLEMRREYLDDPFDKRRGKITNQARVLELKEVEKRETELKNAGRIVLQDLRRIWAELALPPEGRKERESAVMILCGDLAVCSEKSSFRRLLSLRIKDFRKKGFRKDEVDLIEDELERMSP